MWDVLNLGISIMVAVIVIVAIDGRGKAILAHIACSAILVACIDGYLSHGQLSKDGELIRALLYIALSAVLVAVIKRRSRRLG